MKKNLYHLPLLLIPFSSSSQRQMPLDEIIINSTIKIETFEKKTEGGKTVYSGSSGTGFIFSFKISEDKILPVIVTNKHVIVNSYRGILYFKTPDSTGFPIYGKTEKLVISDFSAMWTAHPDTAVDLAIAPLMPILNNYKALTGKNLFYTYLTEEIIPTDSVKRSFIAMEEIIMLGYPYGLRDTVNDLPIVRRGISATPIFLNFNSKKEFLADMPVYIGSSGSPILVYNHGS